MTKQKWTNQEKSILRNNISDGILVSDMCKLIPNHPESGIVRVAQTLNFGVKTKDGVKKFYANKSTRNRTKKTVKSVTIIGAKRATTNNSAPITSVRTNQNLTDAIVPQNSDRDALISIYDDVQALLQSQNYSSLKSITVATDKVSMTILKDAS